MVDATAGGGVGDEGILFPVVFFDGECETSIGNVFIHPAMDYKSFLLSLTRKIGISPHQYTVYIADCNNRHNCDPITAKVDFLAVCRQVGRFFLVVLKRSRRLGSRKEKNDTPSPKTSTARKEPPANAMLLRRGSGYVDNTVEDGRIYSGLDELERRVRDLRMEKERYLVNLGRADLRIEREPKAAVCDVCESGKAAGRAVEFHCCVYDPVVVGFRSTAGPVARPGKGPG